MCLVGAVSGAESWRDGVRVVRTVVGMTYTRSGDMDRGDRCPNFSNDVMRLGSRDPTIVIPNQPVSPTTAIIWRPPNNTLTTTHKSLSMDYPAPKGRLEIPLNRNSKRCSRCKISAQVNFLGYIFLIKATPVFCGHPQISVS